MPKTLLIRMTVVPIRGVIDIRCGDKRRYGHDRCADSLSHKFITYIYLPLLLKHRKDFGRVVDSSSACTIVKQNNCFFHQTSIRD